MKKEGRKIRRDDETIKIVGKNITKYRKLKGLSGRQLAIACDIEHSSLNYYEHGKVEPSISTLTFIAKALDIKIARLFDEPEHQQ